MIGCKQRNQKIGNITYMAAIQTNGDSRAFLRHCDGGWMLLTGGSGDGQSQELKAMWKPRKCASVRNEGLGFRAREHPRK